MLTPLEFKQIENILGGAIAIKINKELRKAFLDCADAPELTAARSVTLKIDMKPQMQRGEFIGCEVSFGVGGKIPTQAVVVNMKAGDQGLLFQPDAVDNPNQTTFPYERDENP